MARRHQRGWLRIENRSYGKIWVLFFRMFRKSDGKRVQRKFPIGLLKDLPTKSAAWEAVERQHLLPSQMGSRGAITFADLAWHYVQNELCESHESIASKAHTTIGNYRGVLRNRVLPYWGNRVALSIEPLEVENWLRDLKRSEGLANPTLDRTRKVMNLVYRHSQRYGLIPRSEQSNPMSFVRCQTSSEYESFSPQRKRMRCG